MTPRFLIKWVVSGAILLRGRHVDRGMMRENLDVFIVSSWRGIRGHTSARGGGQG